MKNLDEKEIQKQIIELQKRLTDIGKELTKVRGKSHEPTCEQGLEIESKAVEEKISFLESKIREAEMGKSEQEAKKILLCLRNERLNEKERFETLKDAARIALAIRNLLGARVYFDRVDFVRVLVKDENWRLRLLPQVPHSVKTGAGFKDAGFTADPVSSLNPVYLSFPYQKALELASRGMVEIIEGGEVPKYEQRILADREPEVLASLEGLDCGFPIEIDGGLSPEMEKLRRQVGSFFRLNLEEITRLL